MRKALVPVIEGFKCKDKGSDFRFTCKACGEQIVVAKSVLAGFTSIFTTQLKAHKCPDLILTYDRRN